MTEITDKLILDFIKRFYRPFDSHEEFKKGFSAFTPAISEIRIVPAAFRLRRGITESKLPYIIGWLDWGALK